MVTDEDADPYTESAAMVTVKTQLPSTTALTVVPDKVQTPAPLVSAQVTAPVPLEPLRDKAEVAPGASEVGLAAAVMLWLASEIVNVTAVAPDW